MGKTLIIGLGGTGGRIINCVTQDLKKRNIEVNNGQICCLAIDTNENDIRRLMNYGVTTFNFNNDETVGDCLIRNVEYDVRNWMPTSEHLLKTSMLAGCAQNRYMARLSFYDAIKNGTIRNLERELEKLLVDCDESRINVMIVSSLAGGTGSSLVIQVAMWVRSYFEKWKRFVTVRGIFLLPDVFVRTINQIGNDRNECEILRANAYAAIRELNAIQKIKKNSYKPSSPIKLDELGFDSEKESNNKPVYDFAFLIDEVAPTGVGLNSIVDYEKMVANMVYMQMFSPISHDIFSEEDNLFRLFNTSNEPLYNTCGIAKAVYPKESVIDYCALRAIKDSLNSGWTKIDHNIEQIIEKEKMYESEEHVHIDPRKEYIRLFDQLSHIMEGREKLLYKIRNDINDEKIGLKDGREVIYMSDKINNFNYAIDEKINNIIQEENLGCLNKIKIRYSKDEWINERSYIYCIDEAKDFIREKREHLKDFVKEVDANCYRLALRIANSICPTDMRNTNVTDLCSIMGLFTKMNEDGETYFIHPIAARYLSYRLLSFFEEKTNQSDRLEHIRSYLVPNSEGQYQEEIEYFDKWKTEEIEDALSYLDKKPLFKTETKFVKEFLELYYDFNKRQYESCCRYAQIAIGCKVTSILIERIEALAKIYETFFKELDGEKQIIDNYIYANIEETEKPSDNTIYVCASGEEKEQIYKSLGVKADSSNTDVNELIIKSLYAQLCDKEREDTGLTGDIKKKTVEAYREFIEKEYSYEIDLDLYSAVCKSSDFGCENKRDELDEAGSSRYKRYKGAMKDLVNQIKRNSNPYLNVDIDLYDEEMIYKTVWGINPQIAEACPNLGKILGVNVDTMADDQNNKNELICYTSTYGIKASDIEKLNELKNDIPGNFYGCYEKIVNQMECGVANGRKEALVMTPHIDKTWHKILPFISSKK